MAGDDTVGSRTDGKAQSTLVTICFLTSLLWLGCISELLRYYSYMRTDGGVFATRMLWVAVFSLSVAALSLWKRPAAWMMAVAYLFFGQLRAIYSVIVCWNTRTTPSFHINPGLLGMAITMLVVYSAAVLLLIRQDSRAVFGLPSAPWARLLAPVLGLAIGSALWWGFMMWTWI